MNRILTLASLIAVTLPTLSFGSTPRAYAALDRQSSAACIASSGFRNATISPAVRFSDRFAIDARTVTGTYPQAHMRGATGSVLCLYNRQTRRAETQDMMTAAPPTSNVELKDIWWRAEEIDNAPVGSIDITLMFGSDGKVTGKSACNNYSANYMITDATLRVYPGMIGTRMACRPPLLAMEERYKAFLSAATSVSLETDGSMLLKSPRDHTVRFVRASTRPN